MMHKEPKERHVYAKPTQIHDAVKRLRRSLREINEKEAKEELQRHYEGEENNA